MEKKMSHEEALRFLNPKYEQKPAGDVFMDIIAKKGFVVAIGVSSALDACLARMVKENIEASGGTSEYDAIYAGGWSFSCSRGYPDMGFLNRQIMADHMENVVRTARSMPVIGDAETGYGDPKALTLTVKAYAKTGLAVAHLEDQDEDRACGHGAGRTIVSSETMVAKLKSWRLALIAIGSHMRLLARTDAIGSTNGGLKTAIERGKRYMDAEIDGHRCADLLWAEFATPDRDVIKTWVDAMRRHDSKMPLAINYSPNKDWPEWYRKNYPCEEPPSYRDLHKIGYSYIFHTIAASRMIMEAVYRGMMEFGMNGATALHVLQDQQRGMVYGRPQAIAGMTDWQNYAIHVGGEEAEQRLAQSAGFGDGSGKLDQK